MDVGKLPTDNLYKFVAISGVALVVAAVIWPVRVAGEIENKIEEKAAAVHDGVAGIMEITVLAPAEGESIPSPKRQHAPPANTSSAAYNAAADAFVKTYEALNVSYPDVKTEKEEERRVWRDFFVMLDEHFRAERILNVEARKLPIEEMGKLLSAPEVFGRKVSDEEIQAWHSGVEIARLQKSENARRVVLNATSIWRLVDESVRARQLGNIGLWAGNLIAVLGFTLWWIKVQRWQDALLRNQAREVVKGKPERRSRLLTDAVGGVVFRRFKSRSTALAGRDDISAR